MDPFWLIKRRKERAHELRDPMYGGPTSFDHRCVKRQRMKWAYVFKMFCGALAYKEDELIELAQAFAREQGPATLRGETHDEVLRQQFIAWVRQRPDFEDRRARGWAEIALWNRSAAGRASRRLRRIEAKIRAASPDPERPKMSDAERRRKAVLVTQRWRAKNRERDREYQRRNARERYRKIKTADPEKLKKWRYSSRHSDKARARELRYRERKNELRREARRRAREQVVA